MIQPLPAAIVFDFDLTLVDSTPAFVHCHAFASRQSGLQPPPAEAVAPTIGTPLPEVFLRLHGRDHLDKLDDYLSAYQQHADEVMTGLTRIIDGVPETLRALRSSGLKLGIVSQKLRHRVEDVLRAEGLLSLFDAILGGDDLPDFKPDPRGLLLAIERLNAKPNATLYVGDTVIDAETAHRAGVGFVAVLTGPTTADEFAPFKPIATLASAGQLPAFLNLA